MTFVTYVNYDKSHGNAPGADGRVTQPHVVKILKLLNGDN